LRSTKTWRAQQNYKLHPSCFCGGASDVKIENYRRMKGLMYKKLARMASIGNEVIRKIVERKDKKHKKAVPNILRIIDKETSG